ncbi:MAG TPA: NfeD family protein [Acidimicrobiales bacterium]|nr:NfeD family protein [Acidimicrobiales bacterium]
MAVVWLVLGVILVAFELHHWAFYAMFGAIGAFAAAVIAVLLPGALGLQCASAVAVAAVGVLGVRPFMSRITDRRHLNSHVAKGVHGGIVGQNCLTLDDVGDEHHAGHVLLAGERWLAVSGSGETIRARTPVTITAVAGTTLVVWAVEGLTEGTLQ